MTKRKAGYIAADAHGSKVLVGALAAEVRASRRSINEPDWLCAVEFLNDEDTEGRDLAADTIGYLLGYARLTNTRSLALKGDPSAQAYALLFSFSGPENKARFLEMVRSNDDLGNDYVEIDLLRPILDEIRGARPIAAVLPQDVLVRATLVAATICSATSGNIH